MIPVFNSSVVDPHRSYAVSVPDPDWYQNDADPHADPAPSFRLVGKSLSDPLVVQGKGFESVHHYLEYLKSGKGKAAAPSSDEEEETE